MKVKSVVCVVVVAFSSVELSRLRVWRIRGSWRFILSVNGGVKIQNGIDYGLVLVKVRCEGCEGWTRWYCQSRVLDVVPRNWSQGIESRHARL